MISLTAGSTPVVSDAKTIIRLAVHATLPSWLSPHRPQRPRHSRIAQQAEQDRRSGARSSYSYWDNLALCLSPPVDHGVPAR